MFFNEIIHATQYYRSPTPLPEEWEGDISNMENFNLDTIQIRINWRQNERKEGEYEFSDVDRLLELAKKYNKRVIMKFLLECAPQYVFDRLGGVRIGPRGEQLRGGYHGAFYGGWKPCFTNPKVKEAAQRFVNKVVERYYKNESIILWNVWNEPRNKPIEECFCEHCRKGFGKFLESKFETVEKLNQFYGATEESFDTINLPAMPHGYWDMYEFKKYKAGTGLRDTLRFVYDEIRKYDKERPIMSHVGFTSAFQCTLDDCCDDYTVSKAVDFWGTSIPCDTTMDTHEKRMDFQMLNDFLRSVDENYFLHEIYPGLGMFLKYDTNFDMNFKLYSALASGAKGLVYWQYRAERVGHECDCSGIMHMDGSPREVAYEVKDFGEQLRKNKDFFKDSKAKPAEIAIVFDYDCLLLSEIEDSCGPDYTFGLWGPHFYYKNAHTGMYRLLRDKNYAVDYVGVGDIQKFDQYKVLYLPYYTMIKPEVGAALKAFIEKGGIVIADEGFGMRTLNTWMQPYDIDFKPVLNARRKHRIYSTGEKVSYQDFTATVRPVKTNYEVQNAEVLAHFDDGKPALFKVKYGKGALYLSGFSLGYGYHSDKNELYNKVVEDILANTDVCKYAYADAPNGLYEKRLQVNNGEMIFLFNATEEDKVVEMQEKGRLMGDCGTFVDGKLTIPALSTIYFAKED